MSWLVNSIANSLKLDDDDGDRSPNAATTSSADSRPRNPKNGEDDDQITPPRGVKEDLSELSKTLTRQFWGVASFLAPPPQDQSDSSDRDPADPAPIAGIRSDSSEIGGKFRTGISNLSSNKAVSEFTKIASNLLQFASEDEELSIEEYAQRGVIGVTKEVVTFARDIAQHPETWLDFPLPDDDDEPDFELSDTQQEHALAVERLAPELASLRIELCLSYMSEASFWKIYFVLVHPRLSRHDAEILSTPEIVKARAMLSQDLRSRGKPKPSESGMDSVSIDKSKSSQEEHLSVPEIDHSEYVPVEISAIEPTSSVDADIEMDKHAVTSTEIPVIDKAVIEEVPPKQTITDKATASTSQTEDCKDEDDADDWLEEENVEEAGTIKGTSFPLGNDDDDISFSDLEEDDDVPTSSKKAG